MTHNLFFVAPMPGTLTTIPGNLLRGFTQITTLAPSAELHFSERNLLIAFEKKFAHIDFLRMQAACLTHTKLTQRHKKI
jgi:hypothetical protein